MLKAAIVATVKICTRHAWTTIIIGALFGVISGIYAATHFSINTDINKLISPDLTWRKREIAFERSFPERYQSILAVVDAPTPELVTQATAALVAKLSEMPEVFLAIAQPGGGPFFR
ncbi:MAG: uncharacterized protein QOG38_1142, partial [Hyphomicrobiales bacterium]|nr:uncharacterized protein [Hyphomicrobiales bacterium]